MYAFLGSLLCAVLMEEGQRSMLFLGSLLCAVLMAEGQRSMLFWGASAARC